MKKSDMYRLAQLAVLKDEVLCSENRLEIIKELMSMEDLELFREKQEEKKNAETV